MFSLTPSITNPVRTPEMGIWNINPEFLLGIYLRKLPLEEMLFFVITNLMVLQVSTFFYVFLFAQVAV
jgi:hypothetical protein